MADEEYYKRWYEKNREKHLRYMNQKIKCKCGRYIMRKHLTRHKNGPLHNRLIGEPYKSNKVTLIKIKNDDDGDLVLKFD
jgi:hypothetical protein